MKSITRFGSYGFMCAMLAAQLALPVVATAGISSDADRAAVDTKKAARSAKREVKKAGRDATGQGSGWKDFKDSASDSARNAKDEANFQAREAKRKTE